MTDDRSPTGAGAAEPVVGARDSRTDATTSRGPGLASAGGSRHGTGRPRIAVVETSAYGGLLHYATQLANALAALGCPVDLLVSRGNELEGQPGAARQVGLFAPTTTGSRAPAGGARHLLRRVGIAVRLTGALVRLVRRLTSGRYDAVIVQWDLSLTVVRVAARVLLRHPRRPAVAFVLHNVRPLNQVVDGSSARSGRLSRAAAAAAGTDLVLVHGQRSLEEYERTWPPARVVVMPHGDQSVFGVPPAPAAGSGVLFFGDWRRVKGLTVLMAAFPLLLEQHPEATLTIAGNPVPSDFDDTALRVFAAHHGDKVRLVDRYVPMDEVPGLFGAARVVVLPYLAGYQSGVLHLAMTMARAVVVTDVGELAQTVEHGRTGLVVPPADPVALADALAVLLADRSDTDRMAASGRAWLEAQASWTQVAETVLQALSGSQPDPLPKAGALPDPGRDGGRPAP